jgi:hypothetical protein
MQRPFACCERLISKPSFKRAVTIPIFTEHVV